MVCVLPVCHSLLQLFQQVFIKFVELGQIVQDLIQYFLLHQWLPARTSRFGNGVPEILTQKWRCKLLPKFQATVTKQRQLNKMSNSKKTHANIRKLKQWLYLLAIKLK